MLQDFPAIGIAIIVTAIIIGVGYVVITNFISSTGCASLFTFNSSSTLGGGAECYNTTNAAHTVSFSDGASSLNNVQGYLGTSGGGLGSWILPVIALFVGLMFIGSIMGKKKY